MTFCPQSGLEDGDLYDGAWCAEQQDTKPWLQVDAKTPVRFSGVITQGRNSIWRCGRLTLSLEVIGDVLQ